MEAIVLIILQIVFATRELPNIQSRDVFKPIARKYLMDYMN